VDVEIVSGTAKGADQLGERYAQERGFRVMRFKPDWGKHHRGAAFVRNKEMAEYADGLVAFWDGKSKATAMMIELAKKRNLVIHIAIVTFANVPAHIFFKGCNCLLDFITSF